MKNKFISCKCKFEFDPCCITFFHFISGFNGKYSMLLLSQLKYIIATL